MKKYFIGLVVLCVFLLSGCSSPLQDKENKEGVRALDSREYNILKKSMNFMVGAINECTYRWERVYSIDYNAYDAGGGFINSRGKRIGSCGGGWDMKRDPICDKVKNCKRIYAVSGNIYGYPAVDVYGLEDKSNTIESVDTSIEKATVKKLLDSSVAVIEQCSYDGGKKAYSLAINTVDINAGDWAPYVDSEGKLIPGVCRGGEGPCVKMIDCRAVYARPGNIYGYHQVDVYGVGGNTSTPPITPNLKTIPNPQPTTPMNNSDDTLPRDTNGVLVPAVSFRFGRVNQWFDTTTNIRKTDPEGVNPEDGASIAMDSAGNFNTAGILGYCKTYYPRTMSVINIGSGVISNWREAGNRGPTYKSTKPMWQCVQGK